MKKNIIKKLFIKISKLFGLELIDQNEFYSPTLDKEIDKKKSEKGKETWQKQKKENLTYLNSNKSVIFSALTGFKLLMKAKVKIINKLKKIEGVGTFLEDEDGYRVTSPEGFVAIKDGSAVKLVDRLEFSRANFTVAKNWSK